MFTFLAVGDSYSACEAVAPAECWISILASTLRREHLSIAEPIVIARTGWTTGELLAAIEARNLDGNYDVVTLLIGVNNQYRGRDAAEYELHFEDLLRRAIRFARNEPSRVIVLPIPDWGVMPFASGRDRAAIAAEIDRYNAVNRRASQRAGSRYVDTTAVSRQAAHDDSLRTEDGLHPSGKLYRLWADAMLPSVREILTGRSQETE